MLTCSWWDPCLRVLLSWWDFPSLTLLHVFAVWASHTRLWWWKKWHCHDHLQPVQPGQETKGACRKSYLRPHLTRTHGQPGQPLRQWAPTRSFPSRAQPLVPHSSGHRPKSTALHILLSCGEPSPHRQPLPDHLPPLLRYGQLALLDLLSILLAFARVQRVSPRRACSQKVCFTHWMYSCCWWSVFWVWKRWIQEQSIQYMQEYFGRKGAWLQLCFNCFSLIDITQIVWDLIYIFDRKYNISVY